MPGPSRPGILVRWLRFGAALTILAAALAFLVSGPRPPGMAGRIIERNLRHDVQATALFYMDLDRMPEIERRLAGGSPHGNPPLLRERNTPMSPTVPAHRKHDANH